MSALNDSSAPECFEFLSSDRKELFISALQKARTRISTYVHEHGHAFLLLSKASQRNLRRVIYAEELVGALKGADGVTIRNDNNGLFLVFDSRSVVHPKKVTRKKLLAWLPKALGNTRARQLPLDGFITDENIPLGELQGIVAGFVENDIGDLIAFFFTDQEGRLWTHKLELEFATVIPFTPPVESSQEDATAPGVAFKAKKKEDKSQEP